MDELTPSTDPQLPEGYDDVDAFLDEARERFQEGVDADRENRDAGLDDLKFLMGEGQWDPQVRAARLAKGRPCLTINTLPQFVGQVIGDTRTNRPSIKVRPAEDGDKQVADIRQGLIRFIENQSNAQQVYALAGEDQVSCGVGNFRVGLDWSSDETFDKDINLKHIPNPFAVVWDPLSVEATGADARFCFVVDEMDRDAFEKAYPDAETSSLTVPQNGEQGWVSRDSVRVTEYWLIKETAKTMALLQPDPEAEPQMVDITGREDDAQPFMVKGPDGKPKTRQVVKKTACMYLISGKDILAGPVEYPISRLPIFKVTGREVRVGDRRYRFGLIRFAKDPIRIKNLMRSAAMEWVAKAPKRPMAAARQRRAEATATATPVKSGDPVLTYSGQIAPQRIDPPSAPAALLQEAQFNDQDIKDVTGLHDASLGMKSNETSGKAIMARERQGDVATFMYHDNLSLAIQQCGKVINELLPTVYDTARTIAVLGEDETVTAQRINDPTHPQSVDLGNGKYDIVVETGPSYSTKRVESAESMMQFVQAVPQAGQLAGDLIAQAQDWPGADAIAERLKKALPPGLAGDEHQQQGQPGMPGQPPGPSPQEQAQAQQMQAQQEAQQMARQKAVFDLQEQEAKVRQAQANALMAEANARKAQIEAQMAGMQPMQPQPMPTGNEFNGPPAA
jgi:hypothetical protein